MDTPAPKQRSPWFYVMLGCGGLVALTCVGSAIFLFGVGKAARELGDEGREERARKQLGAIPEGYVVSSSQSILGLMETTVLTTRADGGDSRGFRYFRVAANENAARVRDFLSGKTTDPAPLARAGINLDVKDVVKRGELTIAGRKVRWLASLGEVDTTAMVEKHETVMIEGRPVEQTSFGTAPVTLNTALLFDCADDTLRVGIWTQPDPDPEKDVAALELAGTVADEAELSRFLASINPCGH